LMKNCSRPAFLTTERRKREDQPLFENQSQTKGAAEGERQKKIKKKKMRGRREGDIAKSLSGKQMGTRKKRVGPEKGKKPKMLAKVEELTR